MVSRGGINWKIIYTLLYPGGSEVKASDCVCLQRGRPGFHPCLREDPLKKEIATHSSILAWRIPWTEKPGGLQSTGSQRVGQDWATSLSFSLSYIKEITNKDLLYSTGNSVQCYMVAQMGGGFWKRTDMCI